MLLCENFSYRTIHLVLAKKDLAARMSMHKIQKVSGNGQVSASQPNLPYRNIIKIIIYFKIDNHYANNYIPQIKIT